MDHRKQHSKLPHTKVCMDDPTCPGYTKLTDDVRPIWDAFTKIRPDIELGKFPSILDRGRGYETAVGALVEAINQVNPSAPKVTFETSTDTKATGHRYAYRLGSELAPTQLWADLFDTFTWVHDSYGVPERGTQSFIFTHHAMAPQHTNILEQLLVGAAAA